MTGIDDKIVLLAADAGVGVGWFFASVMAFVAEWGWVIGLLCWAGAIPLRRTERYAAGFLFITLITAGAVMLSASVAMQATMWMNTRERASPPYSIRSPGP